MRTKRQQLPSGAIIGGFILKAFLEINRFILHFTFLFIALSFIYLNAKQVCIYLFVQTDSMEEGKIISLCRVNK